MNTDVIDIQLRKYTIIAAVDPEITVAQTIAEAEDRHTEDSLNSVRRLPDMQTESDSNSPMDNNADKQNVPEHLQEMYDKALLGLNVGEIQKFRQLLVT